MDFLTSAFAGHISYYWYLILAVGCIFLEFHFFGEGSSLCIGIGFLAAALFSWLRATLPWEIVAFIVAATLAFVFIRPMTLKYLYKNSPQVNTPADDVLGKTAVVETDIDPSNFTGRVLVAGESWKATADKPLKKGTICVVQKLNGVTLLVTQKEK